MTGQSATEGSVAERETHMHDDEEGGGETRGIGWAIKQLWKGSSVTREGWNGPGQRLTMQIPDAHSKMTLPYIYITTVQGDLVPWLASQTDILATDWLPW